MGSSSKLMLNLLISPTWAKNWTNNNRLICRKRGAKARKKGKEIKEIPNLKATKMRATVNLHMNRKNNQWNKSKFK